MGIKGLLPFLGAAQRDVNIASFRNQRAAVDAYCWLHRGAYSCALQLVMKMENCEKLPFIKFCMKRVNLLRQWDITPIVVFDGADLPMKADTEAERREKRKSYLEKGKALLAGGKKADANDCFQKCVNVTPEMALALIKELRHEKIQVVVAPYEADAQLAYLVKNNLADFVITEDSDLLAFGCPKVFFKMNDNGDGKLVELQDIGKGNKALVGFTPESFRHLCILCGCDYLPSVPGVGPATACKLMKKFGKDPYKVIRGLMLESGKVPSGYADAFRRADHTFLYQLVFDPVTQTQVHLNPLPSCMDVKELEYAGTLSSPSKQVGLARGNINPLTMEIMDTYSPSKPVQSKSASSSGRWNKSAMSSASSGKLYPVNIQVQLRPLPVSSRASHDYKPPARVSKSSSMDAMQDTDLLSMYGKSDSSSVQTSLLDHLSPCKQPQVKLKLQQPGALRNMFAVSSAPRVKSRFFARASVSDPPAAQTTDASRLAVLDDLDRERLTPGSLDSGLGESIGGSQLDTESLHTVPEREGSVNPNNCSSATTSNIHSVKKRLVFDDSNEPSTSKRLKIESCPGADDRIVDNASSLEEEVCASHLLDDDDDESVIDLTEHAGDSDSGSPHKPKFSPVGTLPPNHATSSKLQGSLVSKATAVAAASGTHRKCRRAGLSRGTSSKTYFNGPKKVASSGSDLRKLFGYQKRPSMTL